MYPWNFPGTRNTQILWSSRHSFISLHHKGVVKCSLWYFVVLCDLILWTVNALPTIFRDHDDCKAEWLSIENVWINVDSAAVFATFTSDTDVGRLPLVPFNSKRSTGRQPDRSVQFKSILRELSSPPRPRTRNREMVLSWVMRLYVSLTPETSACQLCWIEEETSDRDHRCLRCWLCHVDLTRMSLERAHGEHNHGTLAHCLQKSRVGKSLKDY